MRDDSLAHYGVKGMKWGVRRADAKFEKRAQSPRTTFAVYDAAAAHVNRHDIDRINNKAKYRDKDFTKPSKLRDQYYKEHEDAMISALRKSAADMGTNASGTRQYGITVNKDGSWDIHTEDVKHASETVFRVIPTFDEMGHIISLSLSDDSMKHYGVKGMKWGVHKSDTGSSSSKSSPAPRLSEDAKTANRLHGKIAKSGTGSLSNQEMRQFLERMDLERRYAQTMATPPGKSAADRGHEQVKKLLSYGDTYERARKFMETPTGKNLKTGFMTAAAAGTAYATGGTSAAAGAGAKILIRRALEK